MMYISLKHDADITVTLCIYHCSMMKISL